MQPKFAHLCQLNVGGSLHYTTIGTLTKHDNMLRAMFSGADNHHALAPVVIDGRFEIGIT